jgi:tetratricopeptide (TPR) repeat protein
MEKSRSIFVANYGPVHPHVSSCLNNIAGIHFAFANYMEAKEYYNQSLKMKEAIYGDTKNKNESVALTHENLGLCALKTADYDEAEEHFDTALTISKAVHGETEYHPSIGKLPLFLLQDNENNSLHLLFIPKLARELHGKAWLKELTGQVQEALTGYEKSLKMSRETYDNLKGQHPDVAKSLYHIGECLRKQAQLDKAQESLREAKNMIRVRKYLH